ncbi:MAG TPA: delta-60 repeat domain-containing protein [Verrucomicrobiota bacterium]|nr:delta-60 repeat domain-containing protein [Verrucomicrobiota bacterium]
MSTDKPTRWCLFNARLLEPTPASRTARGVARNWGILAQVAVAMWLAAATLTAQRPGDIHTNFNTQVTYPGVDNTVGHVVAGSDGSIFAGGFWSRINGEKNPGLARIAATGAYDATFRPPFWGTVVNDIAVDASGNALVAGELYISGRPGLFSLMRLLPSGDLDPEFSMLKGGAVNRILRLPTGRILVGFEGGLVRLLEDGSADATFTNALNGPVYDVVRQPDGRLLAVYGNRPWTQPLVRFDADGNIDPGFTAPSMTGYWGYRAGLQADGMIVVGGNFQKVAGQSRAHLARLKPDGSLDEGFAPIVTGDWVNDLAIDDEGGIWIAGPFTAVNGVPRTGIARLLPDGTLDETFVPQRVNPPVVYGLCLQGEGQVVIGGMFRRVGPLAKSGFARMDRTGAVDPSFNTGAELGTAFSTVLSRANGTLVVGGSFPTYEGWPVDGVAYLKATGVLASRAGAGTDGSGGVLSLAEQADGGLLIAGTFTNFLGKPAGRVARLRPDGQYDTAFNSGGTGADGPIAKVFEVADGKIVLAGSFQSFNDAPRSGLVRLLPDGTLDGEFPSNPVPLSAVSAALSHPDLRLLVAGPDATVPPHPTGRLHALTQNGSLDPAFNQTIQANGAILCLGTDAAGNVLVGGSFNTIGGETRHGVARLSANGEVDPSFDPGAGPDGPIECLLSLPDGGMLVGGAFTRFDLSPQPGLARLGSNGRVDPEFAAECRPARGFTNEVQALAMFADDSMLAAGIFVGASNSRVPYVARFWSGRMPSLSIEHDTHVRIIGRHTAGRTCSLYSSPDLRTWSFEQRLANVPNDSVLMSVDAPGSSSRFFKLTSY